MKKLLGSEQFGWCVTFLTIIVLGVAAMNEQNQKPAGVSSPDYMLQESRKQTAALERIAAAQERIADRK